jgi:hypothetical protein
VRPGAATLLLALAARWAAPALASPPPGDPPGPPSIVRLALPPEGDEREPVALPSEPENTVEVEFPWPVVDWAGRGFTPDPERFAGDFVIEATRGKTRLFVTPVAADAHRVLHVVLAEPGAATRSLPIEFVPAPPGLAWRKVVFTSARPAKLPGPDVSLTAQPPPLLLRQPSPESELGLIRTLRLMLNTTADGAAAIAAANPALQFAIAAGKPRSFGDFTISTRFALRETTTDTLGLCASVANPTARRLLFDPGSWVVRVGDRVYPVRTVDFAGELDPGGEGAAFLVLGRGPNGERTRLLPSNAFEVSVLLAGSVNPRPVGRYTLEGFEPQ